MPIWCYRILFLPAFLLLLPYYAWRALRRGGYARDFKHRLGMVPPMPAKGPGVRRIWLHAVSVGELLAIERLVRELTLDSTIELILTTTTSTGYELAQQRYGRQVDLVALFPVDFLPCRRAAWDAWQPDLAILMEGEIWPEHLAQARQRGVPVLLINARLSDRSFQRYQRFQDWLGPLMLDGLTKVLAGSQQDAERFQALLAKPERVDYTGNLKCDLELKPTLSDMEKRLWLNEMGFISSTEVSSPKERFSAWHRRKGASASNEHSPLPIVIVGASTWPGEEAALVAVLQECLEAGYPVRLLLVPRHAERAGDVIAVLKASGLSYHQRSKGHHATGPTQVYLADTTGELRKMVQLADIAFVGKSLPPHTDGQTPIEAAGFGRPVLFGPGMANFREIAAALVHRGAARHVADSHELGLAIRELIADDEARQRMGELASAWFTEQTGAATRTLDAIRQHLPSRASDV